MAAAHSRACPNCSLFKEGGIAQALSAASNPSIGERKNSSHPRCVKLRARTFAPPRRIRHALLDLEQAKQNGNKSDPYPSPGAPCAPSEAQTLGRRRLPATATTAVQIWTCGAPAAPIAPRKVREASARVAPVVRTSSTRTSTFGQFFGWPPNRKTPRIFRARSECGTESCEGLCFRFNIRQIGTSAVWAIDRASVCVWSIPRMRRRISVMGTGTRAASCLGTFAASSSRASAAPSSLPSSMPTLRQAVNLSSCTARRGSPRYSPSRMQRCH